MGVVRDKFHWYSLITDRSNIHKVAMTDEDCFIFIEKHRNYAEYGVSHTPIICRLEM